MCSEKKVLVPYMILLHHIGTLMTHDGVGNTEMPRCACTSAEIRTSAASLDYILVTSRKRIEPQPILYHLLD
jgi:hypothetical protein